MVALGAIPAVAALAEGRAEGLVAWTSRLAYLGFAVLAATYVRYLAVIPVRAAAYAAGTKTRKELVLRLEGINLDPPGVLGVAVGVLHLGLVAGNLLRKARLIRFCSIGGILLAPTWYVWCGLHVLTAMAPLTP